ncbi:MAG TPA: glucosaminidase domain-containing protein, partial [Planctomycetota bacterium]|nr:glucosaminidase domain-containing protein [Planctomycetota bacterium]
NGRWVTVHAQFAAYKTDADSMLAHDQLLAHSHYYRNAMAHKGDPNAFARALTGVYATDPHYGSELVGIMRNYNLYRFDNVR